MIILTIKVTTEGKPQVRRRKESNMLIKYIEIFYILYTYTQQNKN